MRLVESKAEIIQQGDGLDGLYKHIETCGRVPYKSEDKSDGTVECAKAFVDKMVKLNHLAALEHGTVYLKVDEYAWNVFITNHYREYTENPYSRCVYYEGYYYITTNFRVLVEYGWLDDLNYICEPTEFHEKRYTFKVTTSIGVTREFNRHRVLSILEQSTRYCNYSSDKFNNQISVCIPNWLKLNLGIYELNGSNIIGDGYIKDITELSPDVQFLFSILISEESYLNLLDKGWSPQQAREALPLCTATEAVYTGFADQWKHFFGLRFFESTGKAHPNMLELSTKMRVAAVKAGIWDTICELSNEI